MSASIGVSETDSEATVVIGLEKDDPLLLQSLSYIADRPRVGLSLAVLKVCQRFPADLCQGREFALP